MAIAQQTQLVNDNLTELNADELQSIQGGVGLGDVTGPVLNTVSTLVDGVNQVVDTVQEVANKTIDTVQEVLTGVANSLKN